ncbi:unnamed protein product [Arctogadus glacialis]
MLHLLPEPDTTPKDMLHHLPEPDSTPRDMSCSTSSLMLLPKDMSCSTSQNLMLHPGTFPAPPPPRTSCYTQRHVLVHLLPDATPRDMSCPAGIPAVFLHSRHILGAADIDGLIGIPLRSAAASGSSPDRAVFERGRLQIRRYFRSSRDADRGVSWAVAAQEEVLHPASPGAPPPSIVYPPDTRRRSSTQLHPV